jgi:hypothetical protein
MNERAVLYLLLFACAVFAVTIVAELTAAPDDPAAIQLAAHRPVSSATGSVLRAPRLAQLVATTLARPLFSPTRRPPPQAGNSGGASIADMRLTGIVTEPGERLAIFAATGAKPLIVQEGEEVSGWRIENIKPDTVLVSGPGGTMVLQPKPDKSLVRTMPAAVGPPVPPARFAGPGRPPFVRPWARPGFARPGFARPGFAPPARFAPAGVRR